MRTYSSIVGLASLLHGLAAFAASPVPVEGVVQYRGDLPSLPPHAVTQDAKTCGKEQADESLIVAKGGGLANVVVSVVDPPPVQEGASAAPAVDPVLDQVGCRYTPHVLAARVGTRLIAVNSDPVLHNVHGTAVENRRPRFNFAMPLKDQRRPIPLQQPGLVEIRCDAGHKWMGAYLHVFEHPYFAVSGKDGRFTLPALPPGTYVVEAWHEKLGTKRTELKVPAAKTAPLSLQFP